MKMVNTVELKNRTNALLRDVSHGQAVIVTLRGKPVAALTRLTDAGLEDFVLRAARGASVPETLLPDGAEQSAGATQSAAAAKYNYMSVAAPFGTVYVAYGQAGPVFITMAESPTDFEREAARHLGAPPVHDPQPPAELRNELVRTVRDHQPYRGRLDFSRVSQFERQVLQALRKIPTGQVRTYGELARQLGRPHAARAVGTACARNPLPLLVPCHRVVRTDGGLGGYSMSGGVDLKRRLLEAEGALPALLPLGR